MEKTEITLFTYKKTSCSNFREINLLSKEATLSMNQFYPLFNWDRKQVQISGEVGPGFLLALV